MQSLQISKENAQKAYNEGCADVKKVLENLLGANNFRSANIMDRVKTFEDACKELNINPAHYLTIETCEGITGDIKSILAYGKLIVISKALNEGWKPDWTNAGEYKYYPWFDLSSGSGLSYGGCDGQYSSSYVCSRLCFKSRALAEYAGKQFTEIYKDFFII
jgi:hypothetical protein